MGRWRRTTHVRRIEILDDDGYPLPPELARHSRSGEVSPDKLRDVCRETGKGLGREDAAAGRFRPAREMVEMWRGLDLPAWIAPYALRDARLGYLNGYEEALVSGELAEDLARRAAKARWGQEWRRRLEAVRKRTGPC